MLPGASSDLELPLRPRRDGNSTNLDLDLDLDPALHALKETETQPKRSSAVALRSPSLEAPLVPPFRVSRIGAQMLAAVCRKGVLRDLRLAGSCLVATEGEG